MVLKVQLVVLVANGCGANNGGANGISGVVDGCSVSSKGGIGVVLIVN